MSDRYPVSQRAREAAEAFFPLSGWKEAAIADLAQAFAQFERQFLEDYDFERVAKELAYAFSDDTMGDTLGVWWSSITPEYKRRYIASTRSAFGLEP